MRHHESENNIWGQERRWIGRNGIIIIILYEILSIFKQEKERKRCNLKTSVFRCVCVKLKKKKSKKEEEVFQDWEYSSVRVMVAYRIA